MELGLVLFDLTRETVDTQCPGCGHDRGSTCCHIRCCGRGNTCRFTHTGYAAADPAPDLETAIRRVDEQRADWERDPNVCSNCGTPLTGEAVV